MTTLFKLLFTLSAVILLGASVSLGQSESSDDAVLNATVRAVCGKQVVMLGESASHGDGQTESFKVALVKRLVQECGFDRMYFEASYYEFINIARQLRMRKAVTTDQISAAIGGLWKFDNEFKPLVPFLQRKAADGTIALGGLDDQLGQLGQSYSNDTLLADLSKVLPERERAACRDVLHRRVYSDGYAQAEEAKLAYCLAEIRRTYEAESAKDRVSRDEDLEMIDAMQRWSQRDSFVRGNQIAARDRSMFHNFEWLQRQHAERHKTILWMATVHAAKRGDPGWGDRTGVNFGSLVHQEYGAQAFVCGFSALEGSYRQGPEIHEQPTAPVDSLERRVMQEAKAESVFLGPKQLASYGTIPAAIFRHNYESLPWSEYVDGVVIFRREHASVRGRKN